MRRFVSSLTLLQILPIALSVAVVSCSVFGPVGGAISQGYENTISYFNAYYNAQRLFDEAEQEVITARLNQRGQRTLQGAADQVVPSASRTKFTQVIEKCSGILSDHETSAVVDDALFLIGKSYYYTNDFLKAERKFEELLAKDPDGELSMETQLWLLRCYAENGKREEGFQLGEVLYASAIEEGEEELAGQCLLVLAQLEERTDPSTSIRQLTEAVDLLDSDLDQGAAQATIGDLLKGLGQSEEAAQAYLRVPELTSDVYLRFYAIVNAARAYGSLGRYEDALALADELLDDFMFSPYWNEIRFEVAEAKARLGWLEQANEDYQYIDTTATRTEYGTRAAFRRGWILEHDFGDYPAAQAAYARASGFPVPGVSTVAKQRENGLAKHRALHQRFAMIDSVLAALAEPQQELPDSVALRRPVPNLDSLRAEVTKVQFELGELFFSELEVPDSAVLYYRQVLAAAPDSARTPRVQYIMADLSRRQNLGISPDSLYREIIREYPDSPYAVAAKVALGIPLPKPRTDPARELYADAERVLEQGDPLQAVELFDEIVREHPASEYAAKSRYALGWIYEHLLQEPDSALAQYRILVADYGSSPFAARVRARVSASEAKPEAVQDSLVLERIEKVEAVTPEKRPQREEEELEAPGSRRQQADEGRTAVPPKPPPPKKED